MGGFKGGVGEVMWWDFKALCLSRGAQSSLVEEERFDAPSLEFW